MSLVQQQVDVLLVEDDLNDADLAMHALRRRNLGQHVVHVVDGDKALDFIFTSSLFNNWEGRDAPKVIILDLKLQTVSGLEVLRTLKSEAHTRSIPIVVFTASRSEIERVESYRLGVNSYVIKPADYQKYSELVGEIGNYWVNVNQPPDVHSVDLFDDPSQPILPFPNGLK